MALGGKQTSVLGGELPAQPSNAPRWTWKVWQWRIYWIDKGWEWGWVGHGWNVLRLGKVRLWV